MWELRRRRPREGPPDDLADGRRASRPSTGSPCATCASATSRPRSTRFLEVYNAAWERNWGFVPLTEDEVRHYAKELKPILDENWALVAENATARSSAPRSRCPTTTRCCKHMNGRLLPFGWAKFLWYRRKIDRVRVFALGVKPRVPAHRRRRALYEMHFDSAERDAADGRRDGLDPRDQQADEPRDGGDGRQDRRRATGSTSATLVGRC